MFLIDTNVISEARKGHRADPGVQAFWAAAARDDTPLFLAAVTIGELRRGVELIRHRGDDPQAQLLEQWLLEVLQTYSDRVLDLDGDAAQIRAGSARAAAALWRCLREATVPCQSGGCVLRRHENGST